MASINFSSIIRHDAFRGFVRAVSDVLHPKAAVLRKQIEDAYVRGEWEAVAAIVPGAMKFSITLTNPSNYLRLAQAQARLRRNDDAARTLEAGISQYRWSQVLLRGAAEFAMSQEDWSTALLHWQRALHAPEQENGARSRVRSLPRRGADFDWYELAWRNIAAGWEEWWKGAGVRPLPITYSRVYKVLQVCGENDLAKTIALHAINEYPGNEGLLLEMLPSLTDPSGGGGIDSALKTLLSQMSTPISEEFANRLRIASKVVDDLQHLPPTSESELRILTVRRDSSYETVIRASNIWGEHRIQQAIRRISHRDNWPEREAAKDRLSEAAWLAARRFARGRGGEVGVRDASLAKAVFHIIKHELVLKIPVDRLAHEILSESGDLPIFIELKSLRLRYLASYPGSTMHVFYLYDALRRQGAKVQLVHFVNRPAKRRGFRRKIGIVAPTLSAVPVVTGLRPGNGELNSLPSGSSHLLVPSGIRSVTRVLNQMEKPPIVLSSGSSLSEFAYDRTKKHRIPYDVHANLHPSWSKFQRFKFETEIKQTWHRVDKSQAVKAKRQEIVESDAWLSTGVVDTGDWDERLAETLVPYFAELVSNTDQFIGEHEITDVHIGDYIYAEPSLIADRVLAQGGRVHLWPHSSNPVHVQYHDATEISTIQCVTESGANIWKEAAPTVEVNHEPSLMIPNHQDLVAWQFGQPLSLVVMGGRPVMRHLPILAVEQHEQVYRDFFEGLQPLVDAGKIVVYFKPRGLSGEHEAWLENVVGRASDWKRELSHPQRIELPNPVYASISVGSSALLEGVARGIPGLVVKENLLVRDYISTTAGGLAVLKTRPAIDFLAALTDRQEWEVLREKQRWELAEELGISSTTP